MIVFQEQTDHAFTKAQLKNKWGGCKKNWRTWKKLISENGVGWSCELKTILANGGCWKAKIQVIFQELYLFTFIGLIYTIYTTIYTSM